MTPSGHVRALPCNGITTSIRRTRITSASRSGIATSDSGLPDPGITAPVLSLTHTLHILQNRAHWPASTLSPRSITPRPVPRRSVSRQEATGRPIPAGHGFDGTGRSAVIPTCTTALNALLGAGPPQLMPGSRSSRRGRRGWPFFRHHDNGQASSRDEKITTSKLALRVPDTPTNSPCHLNASAGTDRRQARRARHEQAHTHLEKPGSR